MLDIKKKKQKQKIKNLYPKTFDSLMFSMYIKNKGMDPNIMDLKVQTIHKVIPWFSGKYYSTKKYYVNHYTKFCQQNNFSTMKDYCLKELGCEKPLLLEMWSKTLSDRLITFDSIRKLAQINNWCKDYIDKEYDMIFVDEAQDFDNIMLSILLNDTTIPKIFVGDPRQAIYEWRGCINAFEKLEQLPNNTIIVEFYSTFRIGEPACEQIRNKFDNCWMISKSDSETILEYKTIPCDKYVYLFRSWKALLTTAKTIKNIWIYSYDKQVKFIKRLHKKLQFSNLSEDELNSFADDLPAFLLKLSEYELEELLDNIENNLVSKEDSNCKMYTIHSYKGLENNIIRICNDIDIENEHNIHYVALTRGIKQIIIDGEEIDKYDDSGDDDNNDENIKYDSDDEEKSL